MKFFPRLASKTDQYLRVDGFGSVRDSRDLGRVTTVYFSKLPESALDNPYYKSPHEPNYQTVSFKTHSKTLTQFLIGSIWKDGRLFQLPGKLETVQIDTTNHYDATLGEPACLAGNQIASILPEKYFHLSNNRDLLKDSRFLIVPILNNSKLDWLIVPKSELLRFYCGNSSKLVYAALTGRFDHLVVRGKNKVVNGIPQIVINQPLTDIEKLILLRAANSEVAKQALAIPKKYIQNIGINNNQSDKKNPLSMEAVFPFNGMSTLKVIGKRIFLGDADPELGPWGLYAMRIKHCSYDHGLRKVNVFENFESYRSNGNSSGQTGRPEFPFPPTANTPDPTPMDDQAAGDRRKLRSTEVSFSDYFSEMSKVSINHIPKPRKNGRGGKSATGSSEDQGHTYNDDNYSEDGKGNRGHEQSTESSGKTSRSLSMFLEVAVELRKVISKKGWSLESIPSTNNQVYENTWIISSFPKNIRRVRSWHLNEEGHPRKIIWLEITVSSSTEKHNSEKIYLAEIEHKHSSNGQVTYGFFSKYKDRCSIGNLDSLLQLTAFYNKWPAAKSNGQYSENEFENGLEHNVKNESKKDSIYELQAEAWFNKFKTYRFKHPSFQERNTISKTDDEVNNDDPKEIIKKWAESLHEHILTSMLPDLRGIK